MRFSTFLTATVLPLGILAIPAAPLDISAVERREPGILPTPVKREPPSRALVAPRQANSSSAASALGDLLGNLVPGLKAIGELLQADTIENIKTTIDGLAVVLGNGRANKAGSLVDDVGGLLNDDLINSLKEVLPSVSSLLTKDNINTISSLLGSAGGLLSSDNIKKIESLVTNANNLLTDSFVKQTVGLINDVAPLVSAISQIITTLIQAVLGG